MKALEFDRKVARYAAARIAGSVVPGKGAAWGPLRLRDVDRVSLPASDWVRFRPRLSGICGSDLATIDGTSSRYFEPIVSFPFVPGHEVVGDLEDGSRAVLVPVLHCAVRGVEPRCDWCQAGVINRCERVAFGHLEPGLQSGFCCDTGGGWSTEMVAHPLQLVPIPDELSDEAAVMVEPMACAVHAAGLVGSDEVAVLGAGTLGLLTIAAIRALAPREAPLVATARYPEQQRLARELGADVVVAPNELDRRIRTLSGSLLAGSQLTCGFDKVVDCVGSAESLAQALRVVAPGGEVLVVGMPGHTSLDLTGLWHREVALRGCYAYERRDFDTAIRLAHDLELGHLVSATYPLSRYREAIEHAAAAGARGAVRVCFDLRHEKERIRP